LAIQAKKKRYKAPKARMRPDDTKSKPKRYGEFLYNELAEEAEACRYQHLMNGLSPFSVISSGSVSSFNDEDYEVEENSDEEEQEEPGDYIKGTLHKEVLFQFCLKFLNMKSDLNPAKLLTGPPRCNLVCSLLLCCWEFSWEFRLHSIHVNVSKMTFS